MHLAISDPVGFARVYAPHMDGDGRTAAVKDSRAAIERRGQVPLKPQDFDGCLLVREQLLEHKILGPLLESGEGVFEGTMVWEERVDVDGREVVLPCTARPDWWIKDRALFVDWKTTRAVDDHGFQAQLLEHGYDVGAAWYLRGARALKMPADLYYYVPIINEPPYEVRVRYLDTASMRMCDWMIERYLPDLARCVATNEWPGLSAEVESVGTPAYAFPLDYEPEED